VFKTNKITHKCYSRKRMMDDKRISEFSIGLFIVALTFVFMFMVFFYHGTINGIHQLSWSGLGTGILALVLVFGLLIFYNLKHKDIYTTFEEMVKKDLDEYFSHINREFIVRGLWWRVVPGHYWMELRID